jgi:hypothetical protein
MFRPSQALMKLKIHHPLPLNPRESHTLLNLLTTSFRKQLDKAHGDFQEIQPKPSSERISDLKKRPHKPSDAHLKPTDTHIRAILTNPLLSAVPSSDTGQKDPMEVFEQAVSKGLMTLQYATGCLVEKKNRIVQSPILSVREGMRHSGAGRKVLRWLLSSGIANDNNFLENNPISMNRDLFLTTLMEFIVAEGLQEYPWTWIRRSVLLSNSGNTTEIKKAARLLRLLCQAEAGDRTDAQSLDSAISVFSRAAASFVGTGMPPAKSMALLGPAGRDLIYQVGSADRPLSKAAFETLSSLVPVFVTKQEVPLRLAFLSLRHPEPTAEPALLFLSSIDPNGLANVSRWQERNLISLGLATAKFLLENNEVADGMWVMNWLQTHFAKSLGLGETRKLEEAREEASSLRILDGLSVA